MTERQGCVNAMRNYQKDLDHTIETLVKEEQTPRLLLHSCCAPCSSYVLEYLSEYFFITVFYYNPNIFPAKEYEKRVREQEAEIIDKFPKKGYDKLPILSKGGLRKCGGK